MKVIDALRIIRKQRLEQNLRTLGSHFFADQTKTARNPMNMYIDLHGEAFQEVQFAEFKAASGLTPKPEQQK